MKDMVFIFIPWWFVIIFILGYMIQLRLLRLSFRSYRAGRRNMSTKTIAVLDDSELKDGQMYVSST